MEQEHIQKIFKEFESIEKSIEAINALNTVQSEELKQLKIKQYKTSALLHKLISAVCIAVLFFYFESKTELSEDKKMIIENFIVVIAGAAGISSSMGARGEEKHSHEEKEEFS